MNIELFQKERNAAPIVIAYFSYPACNVCKVLRPKIETLSAQYDEVRFIYVDTHESPQLAGQYTIFTVPTLLIFVEGRESLRLSRNFSVGDVQAFLDRITGLMRT